MAMLIRRRVSRLFALLGLGLLAVGVIGAVGSTLAMIVSLAMARDELEDAFEAFLWSGFALCAACVCFWLSGKEEDRAG